MLKRNTTHNELAYNSLPEKRANVFRNIEIKTCFREGCTAVLSVYHKLATLLTARNTPVHTNILMVQYM